MFICFVWQRFEVLMLFFLRFAESILCVTFDSECLRVALKFWLNWNRKIFCILDQFISKPEKLL